MKLYYTLFFLFILLFSCQSVDTPDEKIDMSDFNIELSNKHIRVVEKIFASIPSNSDMNKLINAKNTAFNESIINNLENEKKYLSNVKKALNLGVYGADISYSRMFEEIEVSIKILVIIKKMSNDLGVYEKTTKKAVERLNNNLNNKDSVISIIKDTYKETNNYLQENGRGSTAVFVIFGGWIETFYIANHLYSETKENKEDLINRLFQQKQSLYNLSELLSFYEQEGDVYKYLVQLKSIMKKFASFNKDDKLEIKEQKMKEIQTLITNIRTEIVS